MKNKVFGSFAVLSASCLYTYATDDSKAVKEDVQQEVAFAGEEEIAVPQISETEPTQNLMQKTENVRVYIPEHKAEVVTEPDMKLEDIDKGPRIEKIFPEIGWNRCMADTACSVGQWRRWWTYLHMKEPVVMNWLDGLKIKIYPKNEMFRSIYVNGKYDPNMIVVLKAFLKPGDTLLDVGANCGYISLPLIKAIGDNGKIIAIEPSTRDYKRLIENISINKLSEIVKPVKFAMGDRVGSKTMLIASEERSASNTLGMKFAFQGIEKETTEDVNVTTIDNIVNMENLTKVNVIKLDVEGSEVRCLEGAKDTLANFKPVIVMSVNRDALGHSKRTVEQMEKILKENGYKTYGLEKDKFNLCVVDGLSKLYSPIVVCLPDGSQTVSLPTPENINLIEKIKRFFK